MVTMRRTLSWRGKRPTELTGTDWSGDGGHSVAVQGRSSVSHGRGPQGVMATAGADRAHHSDVSTNSGETGSRISGPLASRAGSCPGRGRHS
jgi:hypothetical protein